MHTCDGDCIDVAPASASTLVPRIRDHGKLLMFR